MSYNRETDFAKSKLDLKLRRMDADIESLRNLTNKAIRETDKSLDESARIRAENAKIQTENKWFPLVVSATMLGTGAALFGAAVVFVRLFLS